MIIFIWGNTSLTLTLYNLSSYSNPNPDRKDGTYAYYFDINYLTDLINKAGMIIIDSKVATVYSINRKKQSKLKRVFIHLIAKKLI